jgi:hypothetical protein
LRNVTDYREELDDGLGPEDESVGEENEPERSTVNVQASPLKQRIRIKHLFNEDGKKPSFRMSDEIARQKPILVPVDPQINPLADVVKSQFKSDEAKN